MIRAIYPSYATSSDDTSSAEASGHRTNSSSSHEPSDQLSNSNASPSHSHIYDGPARKRVIKHHRKTRQGCFDCKRRKVKCSEERPGCVPCSRNGLRCVYPLSREATIPFFDLAGRIRDPQMQSMAELHSGRLEYTALDMRLLHHFIIDAYPHLPLDCDNVWQREIPGLAHQYNYLMHSLLALAASYLVRRGQPDMAPAAHFHRLRAIEGVNTTLNDPNRSEDGDDALVSACYALAFQNAHNGDSPTGFWITVRTIATLGHELRLKNRRTRFGTIGPSTHAQVMTRRLEHFPRLRPDLVYEGIMSLESLSPLCQFGLERELCDLIMETFHKLLLSSLEGYFSFASIYAMVATMSPSDFERLANPNEHIVQLLQCHFLSLQSIMGPILCQEWAGRVTRIPKHDDGEHDRSTARWADTVVNLSRSSSLRKHLEWTSDIQCRARDGSLFEDIFDKEVDVHLHDCRDVRGEWTKRLGFPDCDTEAARKDYEQRLHEFGRRDF